MMCCTNSLNKGPTGTGSSTTTIPTSQVMKIIQFRTGLAKECVLYIPWSGLRQGGGGYRTTSGNRHGVQSLEGCPPGKFEKQGSMVQCGAN